MTPSPPERVEVDPAFDDTDFRVQDSGAMEEALNSARRLVQPDDGTAMKRGGHDWGIEALAWYCSFHDYYHRDYCDRWGIYVPLSSLHLMDELCLSDLPISRARRWQIAWGGLLAHEQAHFAVDLGVSWLELLLVS